LQIKERPTTWRVAENIFNKQSRTAAMGGPPAWGLDDGRYGVTERWIQPFYGEPNEKKEHFEDLNED
jgi:hypothetical protein